MNRDDAIAKIKKCLALGAGAEGPEAAAAMRQAQKLMAEHQVTDRDLSMIDVHEVRIDATSNSANRWEVALVNLIAAAFGCEMFAETETKFFVGNFVRQRRYVFVGLDASPTVAGYAYQVLSRQCAKARLEHIRQQPKRCKQITKTARGDAFAMGWVRGVADKVERFAQPQRDEALLITYLEQKHPNLKSEKVRDTTKRRKVDGHGVAGFMAGDSAQLAHGVGANRPAGLLA